MVVNREHYSTAHFNWDNRIFILSMSILIGCTDRPASVFIRDADGTKPGISTAKSADVTKSVMTFQERAVFTPPKTYHNGEDSEYFAILEALGGGVSSIDFDQDGFIDVMLPGGGDLLPGNQMRGQPTGLYRNLGNWRFSDVSHVLPPMDLFSHAACGGDFDEDGFVDVLITGYGQVQLLHNEGDGTFRDVTVESQFLDNSWSTSAAWGDLNGDGFLDAFVAHYNDWSFENNPACFARPENRRDSCSPRSFGSLTDAVFLGQGDGTFRSAHDELGFSPGGNGLGVLLIDLDGDQDLDVYVANDTQPNFVYQNQGGTFTDISIISGADRNEMGLPEGSMGLEAGDFNGDLLPDLWVTNFEKESMALYRAHPGGFYQHVSQRLGISGVGSEYVGWGICLADFDGDGDEDVFIATGHANRFSPSAPRFQRPILFENRHGQKFVNVASMAGDYFVKGHLGRGVSGCDFDNDGRCDLAISHLHEPATLLQNTTPTTSSWIGVRLIGRISTRDPIGARIVLKTDSDRQSRFVKSGSSYLSTPDPRLLFHVPESLQRVSLEIAWPSGITQTVHDLTTGQYHVVVESDERNISGN